MTPDNPMSDFWSGWVIVLSSTSLAALIWLVFSIYFSNKNSSPGNHTPVWDSTLREGINAPPMWWFWLVFSLLVFSVIYLILYPGLGNYAGLSGARHNSSHLASNTNNRPDADTAISPYQKIRSSIQEMDIQELQNNSVYMNIAQGVFSRNCAACHGENANGQAKLFPSLRDSDWQWGNTPEQIRHSIANGRKAVMPGWKSVLDKNQIRSLADFVRGLHSSKLKNIDISVHDGYRTYIQYCAACHGEDGGGNTASGASNLSDITWVYGNSRADTINTIAEGRNGRMPAFKDRLDGAEINLLIAWLTR